MMKEITALISKHTWCYTRILVKNLDFTLKRLNDFSGKSGSITVSLGSGTFFGLRSVWVISFLIFIIIFIHQIFCCVIATLLPSGEFLSVLSIWKPSLMLSSIQQISLHISTFYELLLLLWNFSPTSYFPFYLFIKQKLELSSCEEKKWWHIQK